MTLPRPAPLAFALLAPQLTMTEAGRLWVAGDTTVKRWAREQGVAFKPATHDNGLVNRRSIPADFTVTVVREMTLRQMCERWNCHRRTARRWCVELGLKLPQPDKPVTARPAVSILRQPHVHRCSTPKDAIKDAAPRSSLPAEPCFRCGARGWCGHGWRVEGMAA